MDRKGDRRKADLTAVYDRRFEPAQHHGRSEVWLEIGRYLQRFIPANARLLEIGSDVGFFIGSLEASEKVATDLRDMSGRVPPGVRFVQADSLLLASQLPAAHFDAVLMSNFLEHLPTGDAVISQLQIAHGLLRPGGRVVILQPNIRLTQAAYWDFIDHKTALTEHSLVEAATTAGFVTHTLVKRFLPYTTKSRLPQARWMVRGYLKFPPAWLLLGKQTLYIGEKPRT